MRIPLVFLATVAAVCGVVPACAATTLTFNLGSGAGNSAASIFTYPSSSPSINLGVTGYTFTGTPAALTAATPLTHANVYKTNVGLGVQAPGETTVGSSGQVDTTGPNELLSLALDHGHFYLNSATFSYVDPDDTLRIYGITDDNSHALVGLISGGEFNAPPGSPLASTPGVASVTCNSSCASADNATYTVNFVPTDYYRTFYFTSTNNENDGYRLNSVTLTAAVPEASTWAMMIVGFGAVGGTMRRRQRTLAAA